MSRAAASGARNPGARSSRQVGNTRSGSAPLASLPGRAPPAAPPGGQAARSDGSGEATGTERGADPRLSPASSLAPQNSQPHKAASASRLGPGFPHSLDHHLQTTAQAAMTDSKSTNRAETGRLAGRRGERWAEVWERGVGADQRRGQLDAQPPSCNQWSAKRGATPGLAGSAVVVAVVV